MPLGQYERVVMAHGGGGRLMQQLIDELIAPAFDNPWLAVRHDSAVFDSAAERLAVTTDSYVVNPIFFPGGDIGKLAVCGTLNDLAMAGARPRYLSAALILEEGLPVADLRRVLHSMAETARAAGVAIVTGDTKVVERGRGDGLYINTTGIGEVRPGVLIQPSAVLPGDAILINGDVGRHGMAVMTRREGLTMESDLESDCADLSGLVGALLEAGIELHCLRDLTRGGVASAMIEIAQAAGVEVVLDEASIPVGPAVRGACELLGFDPLYVANEGRFAAFVPADRVAAALEVMRSHPLGLGAARIGYVDSGSAAHGRVRLRSAFGVERQLLSLSGEQLPRIC